MAGPDFICIGPKRSATTWLADQLKFHRDVWLPPTQELNYLSGGFGRHLGKPYLTMRWTLWETTKRVIRNKGPGIAADRAFLRVAQRLAAAPGFDLDGYRALFASAGDRITGDISPMYASMSEAEIDRAMPVLKKARVFLLARDPVARFWSELAMHARKRGLGDVDYRSIEVTRAFFDDAERQKQHFLSGIVRRWRQGIGADNLRIVFFDDIVGDPAGSLQRIVSDIGADWGKRLPLIAPGRNRKHGAAALEPAAAVCDAVDRWFAGELDRCAELLGAQGVAWRDRHAP